MLFRSEEFYYWSDIAKLIEEKYPEIVETVTDKITNLGYSTNSTFELDFIIDCILDADVQTKMNSILDELETFTIRYSW